MTRIRIRGLNGKAAAEERRRGGTSMRHVSHGLSRARERINKDRFAETARRLLARIIFRGLRPGRRWRLHLKIYDATIGKIAEKITSVRYKVCRGCKREFGCHIIGAVFASRIVGRFKLEDY